MKEIDLKNYRPFTKQEAEHFIDCLVRQYVNVHKDGNTIEEEFTFKIHGVSKESVVFGDKRWMPLERALSELKLYDGSPFGVKKEESTSEYKGKIKGFPNEVVECMLDLQEQLSKEEQILKHIKENYEVGDVVRCLHSDDIIKIIEFLDDENKFQFSSGDVWLNRGYLLIYSNGKYADKMPLLLTTEDGVDVYDPETITWITPSKKNKTNPYCDSHTGISVNLMAYNNEEWIHFSTEKACEDFIYKEKETIRRNKIFNFFSDNHELILLDGEIDDIINELIDK